MTLKEKFIAAAQVYSGRTALMVEEKEYTYSGLLSRANRIAQALHHNHFSPGMFCALLGGRSAATYTGMLGCMLAGGAYVPCGISFPAKRNLLVLEQAKITFSILDTCQEKHYAEVLKNHTGMTILVEEDPPQCDILKQKYKQHTFISAYSYSDGPLQVFPGKDDPAYILFTSGSTGVPKGVQITHNNVCHYVEAAGSMLSITSEDRFIQIPELSFDFSVHPVWLAFTYGAALYVPDTQQAYFPAHFLKKYAITQYASTTSTVNIMRQLRACPAGSFASVKCSIFCGERLPRVVAGDWQKATPNGQVWNFYGPTEATCACLACKYDMNISDCEYDSVPVGKPFISMTAQIVDKNSKKAETEGELILAGEQLSPGYFNNPQKNASAFFEHDYGDGLQRYYHTGDIVKKTKHGFIYIERNDFQIKFRGYRIELNEIEFTLRNITGASFCTVLPMPYQSGKVDYLQAYLSQDGEIELSAVKEQLQTILPKYMIPEKFSFLEHFPLTANGKIDRVRLSEMNGQ